MNQPNHDAELVFTVAASLGERVSSYRRPLSRDSQCCLLFGKRSSPLELDNLEYHKEIANSDLTREFLGDSFSIIPIHYEHEHPRWGTGHKPLTALIATSSPDRICRLALAHTGTKPLTLVQRGVVQHLDGLDVLNKCGLPDKYIIGCHECVADTDIPNVCPIVSLLSLKDVPEFTVDTYMESVTYWKSHIGSFVAIGPTLTSEHLITPAHRDILHHSFGYIAENFRDRKRGAEERSRYTRFQKEVCNQCAIKEACWYEGASRACPGYYAKTLKDTALEITRTVACNFSGPQLRLLLDNSGPLDRRVGRLKGAFTLVYCQSNREVKFVVNRKTDPGTRLMATNKFAEALSWINTYRERPRVRDSYAHMLAPEKATLLELLARSYSPRYYNGWRSTTYPIYYVKQKIGGGFRMVFSWGHSGRCELPWEVTADSLLDVFKNYRELLYASRTDPPKELQYRIRYC